VLAQSGFCGGDYGDSARLSISVGGSQATVRAVTSPATRS
jgi:hypothetical protein